MEFLFIIIGFILLIKSSDYFIDASINIAKIFNVSEIIIGATIVSIGTTLPEAMVSATSAIKGIGDIAYGNAIGSIICNTSLISSTTILFLPSIVDKKSLKTPVIFFFTSFIFYIIFAYYFKSFSRLSGIVLILFFILYVAYIIKYSKNNNSITNNNIIDKTSNSVSNNNNLKKLMLSVLTIIISAIIIAISSNILVENGIKIARIYNVPESVIGITMMAFGTSLPEFSTAITAILKGKSNLSIGNIIGANFINIAIVTGLSAALSPFNIPTSKLLFNINSSLIVDIPVATISMIVLCLPSIIYGKTNRWQGIIMLSLYLLFIIYQVFVY